MTAAPPPEIPGYRFVEAIGSGGYADVYRYRQQNPARDVAVKVLRDGLGEQVRSQFTDEANAIAELGDHPHIVTVFSAAVTPDDRPYLVMSYCSGENYAVRASRGRFTVNEVLIVGTKVASAVAAAHQAAILHRDIKPANILTDQWGQPRLADFGIAGRMANAVSTDEGAMSVPWAPPEVVRGGTAGVPSDVYSLGATLWHLLVGHSPFWVPTPGDTVEAMMARIVNTPLPPLGRPDVPPEFEAVLRQSMAPSPQDRQRSASVLGAQLQELKRNRGMDELDAEFRTSLPTTPPPAPERGVTQLRPRTVVRRPVSPQLPPVEHTVLPRPAMPRPDAETPAARTQHRPAAAAPEPQTPGRRWPALVLAGGVLAAVLGTGFLLFDGDSSSDTAGTPGTHVTDPGDAMQDAGVPGGDAPPGRPTVTAAAESDGSVRFAWTYSAQLATDTFAWQTPDGRESGVVEAPELVLPHKTTDPLCVQVKVVRADGSHATADWSEPGCAG